METFHPEGQHNGIIRHTFYHFLSWSGLSDHKVQSSLAKPNPRFGNNVPTEIESTLEVTSFAKRQLYKVALYCINSGDYSMVSYSQH